MDRDPARCAASIAPRALWVLLLAVALGSAVPAWAQQADRERAQLLQMQQQLQRLQSDNAALQKERNELQQSKTQEADKLRKESDKTGKALVHAQEEAAAQGRELAGVRAELEAVNGQLQGAQAEIAALRKTVAERNEALQAAAQAAALEKRRSADSQTLLASRLKVQTGRSDLCESRHAGVMKFTADVIGRYESERLRLCEPLTGIWKVHAQEQIQELRAQLYGYRLDIPAPPVLTEGKANAGAQTNAQEPKAPDADAAAASAPQ